MIFMMVMIMMIMIFHPNISIYLHNYRSILYLSIHLSFQSSIYYSNPSISVYEVFSFILCHSVPWCYLSIYPSIKSFISIYLSIHLSYLSIYPSIISMYLSYLTIISNYHIYVANYVGSSDIRTATIA
jgi:hypothetical protein